MTKQQSLVGGIEAGGTKFICGVADGDGNILETIRIPTGMPAETLGAAADFFALNIRRHGELSALSVFVFTVDCFGLRDHHRDAQAGLERNRSGGFL
jgi:fructokinase